MPLPDPDISWGRAILAVLDDAIARTSPHEEVATVVLVIGPVGAGKRTLSEKVCRAAGLALIDPDDAKEILPEYRGGIGWCATHEESVLLASRVLSEIVRGGKGFALPRTGADADNLQAIIQKLKLLNYWVVLINLSIDEDEAYRRNIRRYADTGKFIPSHEFERSAMTSSEAYAIVKASGLADQTINVDRNGPPNSYEIIEGDDTPITHFIAGLD